MSTRKGWMSGTEHPPSIPPSFLPLSRRVCRRKPRGVVRQEEEECSLFGEGKGIDISRNRPLHVDISLPLLRGCLSVGWIKLSKTIPPPRPLKPLHPWQAALASPPSSSHAIGFGGLRRWLMMLCHWPRTTWELMDCICWLAPAN